MIVMLAFIAFWLFCILLALIDILGVMREHLQVVKKENP